MSKLYAESESGGIRVISGRKQGDVRIPNYVYDLWLPLIGGDALSVYSVYCRLERQNVVKAITLKDIAKACRIGDHTLAKINKLLERCGFVVVNKPTGRARGQHYTTEIVTCNPPAEIAAELIAELQPPSGYVPLSTWLVESQSEKPTGASVEKPNSVSPEAKQRFDEKPTGASIAVATQEQLKPLEVAEERYARPRESTPLTFAHANGFGRTSNGHNPAVLAVKAHPVFQAYVRGRGNIEPEVPPPNAPGMLETLKAIQIDIDAGRYGVQDVEELTRFKVGIPHSKAFLLSYIKTDIADFVGGRGKGTKAPAPPSNRQRDPALKDFDARQMVAEMERAGQNDKGWNPFAKEETADDARSSSDRTQPAKTS